ncbi:sugar transferase [Tautonia plasticadhaerens]|uniref:sugar transferase n=1 Tax=Tautonia plasticadhaerens TaxID=2527974 RepID=UPI001E44D971|nr:sugar transferase [Tautonia plasticadhaerens]
MHDAPTLRASAVGSPETGRVLIVGARRGLSRLAAVLDQRPWSGLRIVGFVDRSGRGRQLAIHPGSEPIPVLGRLERLSEVIRRSRPTHVIVANSEGHPRYSEAELLALSDPDLRVHWMAGESESAPQAPPTADVPHLRFRPVRPPGRRVHAGRAAKRAVDVVLSSVILLLLSPVFAAVGLLIYATSGRPIFYLQDRVGQNGTIFKIIKFRSMKPNAESVTGPIWAANHDDRCTPIGDWLRHTCLDELPQIFNILKGEMSLVGPRPERPIFVERFAGEVAEYPLRHVVPVGLTGWAQVHGWRGRTSIRKRLQYDLDYVRRWSFWLDIQILFMTALHVAFGKVDWGVPRNRRVEREPTDALGRDTHS